MRAGHRQGDGIGACSSGVVCEINIVQSEFSECRRTHTHSFEYPLGKPLEAKLLKEYRLFCHGGVFANSSSLCFGLMF